MTVGEYVLESSTTGDIAPDERTDFWYAHVTSYHCRLEHRFPRPDAFTGGTESQRSGRYHLIEFWSDPIEYTRTASQVRSDPDQDYRLLIPLEGRMLIRQDGRQAGLRRGTAGIFGLGEPFQLLHDEPARALILALPARVLDSPLNRTSPLSAELDLTAGLGRVVGDMVTGLHKERAELTGRHFQAACDRIAELVCMLAEGDDRPEAPGHLSEVERLVRRHVRQAAGDPELTGAAVAHALGWSLRQVQLALQRAGTTPRDLIREERLRLANERLQSPSLRNLSVTEIAESSGFSSPSSFSTAYRRRYGMTPREARAAAGGEG